LMFAFIILLKVTPVSTVVSSLLPSKNGSTRLEVITQYYFHADTSSTQKLYYFFFVATTHVLVLVS
jgi:hypothetical protein